MKLGQVLHKRLARALPTDRNLGHEVPLHVVGSGPPLQAVLLDVPMDIEIGQRGERGLQRRQEILHIERAPTLMSQPLPRKGRFSYGKAYPLITGELPEPQ